MNDKTEIETGGMVESTLVDTNRLESHLRGDAVTDLMDLDKDRFKAQEMSSKEKRIISNATCFLKKKKKIFCEQYERVIIFRCGRILYDEKNPDGCFGPGWVEYFPEIDTGASPGSEPFKFDIRDNQVTLPDQEYLTKDMRIVKAGIKLYYNITSPADFFGNVRDALGSAKLMFRVKLRNLVTRHEFNELFHDKKKLSEDLNKEVALVTSTWGVRFIRCDLDFTDVSRILKSAFIQRYFSGMARVIPVAPAVIAQSVMQPIMQPIMQPVMQPMMMPQQPMMMPQQPMMMPSQPMMMPPQPMMMPPQPMMMPPQPMMMPPMA